MRFYAEILRSFLREQIPFPEFFIQFFQMRREAAVLPAFLLDKIKCEKIDLILLDIAMPIMDGIETFRRMKDSSVEIPVIFLTASGYEDDVKTAISLGAVNYLKKPFFPQELLKRVAMGLGEQ